MPKFTKQEYEKTVADVVLQSRREGYAQALLDSGPRPKDEAQAASWLEYYLERAKLKYP